MCVGLQVRQASRCTSTYRTARWTRWSRTCLGVLRRTEAWWREQRWSEIYCGKSLYADSPAENCSTHPLCKRHTLLLCSTEETSSIFAFVSQIPTEPLNKLQHLRGFRHICFFFFPSPPLYPASFSPFHREEDHKFCLRKKYIAIYTNNNNVYGIFFVFLIVLWLKSPERSSDLIQRFTSWFTSRSSFDINPSVMSSLMVSD